MPRGGEQIEVAVEIVVSECRPRGHQRPRRQCVHPRVPRHLGERAVSVVLVQEVLTGARTGRQVPAAGDEEVQIAVAVVVSDRRRVTAMGQVDAAGGLRLFGERAVAVVHVQSVRNAATAEQEDVGVSVVIEIAYRSARAHAHHRVVRQRPEDQTRRLRLVAERDLDSLDIESRQRCNDEDGRGSGDDRDGYDGDNPAIPHTVQELVLHEDPQIESQSSPSTGVRGIHTSLLSWTWWSS